MPDPTYYALLRVRAEKDGRLTPLSYTVGDTSDLDDTTVVGHVYTIAICTVPARTLEEARIWLKDNLSWFQPLLRGAVPDAWFQSEEPA